MALGFTEGEKDYVNGYSVYFKRIDDSLGQINVNDITDPLVARQMVEENLTIDTVFGQAAKKLFKGAVLVFIYGGKYE